MVFKILSSRRTLQTLDGRPLVSIKSKAFSGYFPVYEGGEQDAVSLEIRVEGIGRLAIFTNFYDRVSGRLCRIVLDGNPYDYRVAVFYLEYGQPGLPPRQRRRDLADGNRLLVVGRIRRPDRVDFVEAAPGVAVTLLLLMWRVWNQIEDVG